MAANNNRCYHRRGLEIMPWKMPSIFGLRKCRIMGQDVPEQPTMDAVEALDGNDLERLFNLSDQQQRPGDVSLPDIVSLTMSTPVKVEPEVKVEPASMVSTPSSTPMETSAAKRPRSPGLDLTNSTVTRSLTLESETRSADTSKSNAENTRPPTPVVLSPPTKVRRSTRRACP